MLYTKTTNYNSLYFYSQFLDQIPDQSGVYYWFYWPFKDHHEDDDNIQGLIEILKEFSNVNLNLPEKANTGYKYQVEVIERGIENSILGLSNRKIESLSGFLMESIENRAYFLNYLKDIVFNKPFYIGKANDLRSRLNQHFERRNSDILDLLENLSISQKDIYIGFEIINNEVEPSINQILEEIAQRIIKPGLTKKPG